MEDSLLDELTAVARAHSGKITLLDRASSDAVLDLTREAFVEGNPAWWWEAFKFPITESWVFPKSDGYRHVQEKVPQGAQRCYLIAADDEPFPVLDVEVRLLPTILGSCRGFEYYLVDHAYAWILCETHHDALILVRRQ